MAPNSPVVLHISPQLNFGGIETHLRTIANATGKRYNHAFCAIINGGAEAEAMERSGSLVRVLNVDPWQQPVRTLLRLVMVLRELRPQIVHCHGLEANLFGIIAAASSRVPVRIGEEVGIPNRSAKLRLVMSAVYGFAHRVLGVSDAVRDWLIASGEVPSAKAARLYNPVVMSSRSAKPRGTDQPFRIGFVGRLDPVKNLPALISAMSLLPEAPITELRIVGEGIQRADLEALIQVHGLQDKISLRGFSSEPSRDLASCHLYVQPSFAEGFGIAVVEAMSCGLPAVVSNCGGMPEIVQDGRTGWIIDPPSSDRIADAISAAVRMGAIELARMGQLARQSVEQRFSTDKYIFQLEELYDELRN